MIARAAQAISSALLKSNAINSDELSVYTYGIQLLLLAICDWCITFFIALLMGQISLSLIYLVVFFLLRKHCGGYHAKTHFRCICISNAVFIASILMASQMEKANFIWLIFGEILNFAILFYYAPIAHKNKPILAKDLHRHKIIGRYLNAIISCFVVLFTASSLYKYAWVILFGQLSVSIAILAEKIKNHFSKGECAL